MSQPPGTKPNAPVTAIVPLDDAALDAVIGGVLIIEPSDPGDIVPPEMGPGPDDLTGGYGGGYEPPPPPPPPSGGPPMIPDLG